MNLGALDGRETRAVLDDVKRSYSHSDVDARYAGSIFVSGSQLRQDLRAWLSPPDPSTNHNIACGARHKGTADWFFEGSIFGEWKSTGSLLWVHGKRTFHLLFPPTPTKHHGPQRDPAKVFSGSSFPRDLDLPSTYIETSSTIIEDIISLRDSGLAIMACFYCDFRDSSKQKRRDLLPSLVIQLSARSDPCCDVLSHLYLDHDKGAQKPSEDKLMKCLKEMATLAGHPVYLIIDALDECPDSSGMPSPREQVLDFLKELVELPLPNLHICVTSRPEVDIRITLESLTPRQVSLHNQSGQKKDIIKYVTSVVHSDSKMRRWRDEDKKLIIDTLSERADGM